MSNCWGHGILEMAGGIPPNNFIKSSSNKQEVSKMEYLSPIYESLKYVTKWMLQSFIWSWYSWIVPLIGIVILSALVAIAMLGLLYAVMLIMVIT